MKSIITEKHKHVNNDENGDLSGIEGIQKKAKCVQVTYQNENFGDVSSL